MSKVNSAKSRYVMVEEPDTPDGKIQLNIPAGSASSVDQKDVKQSVGMNMMSAAKSAKSRAGVKMKKPVSAVLVGPVSNTASGANANNQSVLALAPVGVQDWAGFAALYDECRVTKVVAHATASYTASPPAFVATVWGFALDPANGGAYGNLPDVMTARYKVAPMCFTASTADFAVLPVNRTGFYRLEMKLHGGRLTNDNSGSAASEVGGGWFATSSTTSINVGYLKCFIPATGGTGITTFTDVVEYHCEFRDRT